MNYRGLSSIWAKLEPARSKNNEILEINVLQKFTPHAFYKAETQWVIKENEKKKRIRFRVFPRRFTSGGGDGGGYV